MPKVALNACFGGFSLSPKAMARLAELGLEDDRREGSTFDRTDPRLIQVIEELGAEANNELSKIRIADVPDDVKWYIRDDAGFESAVEEHREW